MKTIKSYGTASLVDFMHPDTGKTKPGILCGNAVISADNGEIFKASEVAATGIHPWVPITEVPFESVIAKKEK